MNRKENSELEKENLENVEELEVEKTKEELNELEKANKALEEYENKKRKHRKAISEMTFEMEDLDDFHKTIAAKIGIDAYREVVKICGGTSIYFPRYTILIERRKKEYVYNLFQQSGENYNMIANYCGISISTVRRYIREYKRFLYEQMRKENKKKREKEKIKKDEKKNKNKSK